jgi:hypothetical protein
MKATSNSDKEIKWQRGEVKKINLNLKDTLSALAPSGSSSARVNPQLGTLWMLQIQISPQPSKRSRSNSTDIGTNALNDSKKRFVETDNRSKSYGIHTSSSASSSYAEPVSREDMFEGTGYRNGDLLVCRNSAWGNRCDDCMYTKVFSM